VGSTTGDEDEHTAVEPLPEPPTIKSLASTVLSSSGPNASSPEGERELEAGTDVGEYRVEAKIGEGAMGVVYAAVHPVISKRVAVKVLKQSLCDDRGAIERFIDEARVVNEIGNPNIVDVFAFGTLADGRHYLVMEWMRGESLRDRVAGGALPLDEVCDIGTTLARALDAAHAKGVIHRDLKPDNVFLIEVPGEPPRVKLLDFGIAKLANDEHHVERTLAGEMVGTPQYVAPEQARGVVIDHRADIYSLGVVLYELITGQPPFQADNAAEMIAKHLIDPAPEPSLLRDETPEPLDDLVTAMLAKHPSGRPSLADVQATLKRVRGELATTPMRPLRIRDIRISASITTPIPVNAGAEMAMFQPALPASLPPRADSASSTLLQQQRPTTKERTIRFALIAVMIAGVGLAAQAILHFAMQDDAKKPAAAAVEAQLAQPAPPPLTVTPIPDPVAPGESPSAESPPAAAAAHGRIQVKLSGAGSAEFVIDHQSVGTRQELDLDVAAGPHQVEIRADGFTTQQISVDVAAGDTVQRAVSLHRVPAPADVPVPEIDMGSATTP